MKKYILIDNEPKVCNDLLEWATWFENPRNRIVKQTKSYKHHYVVSTVFLGLDHSFWQKSKPILFETMVFTLDGKTFVHNKEYEALTQRYCSYDEALAGHKKTCRYVKALEIKMQTILNKNIESITKNHNHNDRT